MEIELTVDNFENEVVGSQTPVLVDFWAPWCGPCKAIAPYVKKLAQNYSGKIKVCKLNVDDAPALATKYAIMSIPALLLFDKGKVMEKKVGAMGQSDLEKFIQPYI